ncbi:MAG: nicotinamide-nucleotide amidohydrolase family protein [Anaerolineae bacterium]|nr:nicotinamide-nucleotide amidohydrolase family protein [Anaerolineae bacterium]
MTGDKSLEVQVGELLLSKNWTVGTAESCTGGLIAHRLTNIAGSSAYVLGGIVAYSNTVKQSVLGVHQGSLIAHGAVSETVAAEMALGARRVLAVDVALSVTGIAGPGGGTVEKPVGLTYIGLAGPDNLLVVRRHLWNGSREAIKTASADAALALLLELIT